MEATQFTTQDDPNRERVLIYADLGALPSEPLQTTLLTRMLQVSLFGRRTAGGALGLAPDLDPDKPLRIVLWKAMEVAALDLPALEQGLRQFINTVDGWRDALPEWTENALPEPGTVNFVFDPTMGIRV